MENNIFEQILSKKRVPILLNYKPYQTMIKLGQSQRMKELSKELQALINTEKKQILEVNSLHKEKSRITAKILYLSNEINSSSKNTLEKDLDQSKSRMEEIRTEILEKENKIQDMIYEKESKNIELLKETVNYAYEYMKKDEVELKKTLIEIEKLREKLKKDREKREFLEKRINSIYGFLHGIVGAKDTEILDENIL